MGIFSKLRRKETEVDLKEIDNIKNKFGEWMSSQEVTKEDNLNIPKDSDIDLSELSDEDLAHIKLNYEEKFKEVDGMMSSNGLNYNTYQEQDLHDDLQVIDYYIDYDKNDRANYLMFNIRVKEDYEDEWTEMWKAVKLLRITGIPRAIRDTDSLMAAWDDVLTGLHDSDVNFITLMANILKPERIGLVYCYGVQAVAETAEEAQKTADIAYQGLYQTLMGNFSQIEYRLLTRQEADWIDRQMREMKHLLMLRGIPKARKNSGSSVTRSIGGGSSDPNAEEQNEEFLRGMMETEYLLLLLTSPVGFRDLEKWLNITSDQLSMYKGEMAGTKGISAGISIPIAFMGNLGAAFGKSLGESNTFGHAVGISHADSTGISSNVGLSESVSSSHSEGISQSNSVGQGTSHTDGFSNSQGLSYSEGSSFTTGNSSTTGTSFTDGISHTIGNSYSQSISEGTSASHSTGVSNTNSIGISHGVSASTGTSHGSGLSNSSGISDSVGESSALSNGTSTGTSQSFSHGLSFGTSDSTSHSSSTSEGASTGISHGTSHSSSEGTSASVGNSSSVGTSSSIGVSKGEGYSHVIGNSHTQTQSQSHGTSDSLGTSQSSGRSDSTSGSWSDSSGTSHSNSQSSGGSSSQSQSQSSGTSTSYGTSTSEGFSQTSSKGESSGSSQSSGVSFGNSNTLSSTVSNSNSASVNIGHSTGVNGGVSVNGGSSLIGITGGVSGGGSWGDSFSAGTSNGHSEGQSAGAGITQGYSGGVSASHGFSASESSGHSVGQSFSSGGGSSSGTSTGISQGSSWSSGDSNGTSQSSSHGGGTSSGTSQSAGISQSSGISNSWGQSSANATSENYGSTTSNGLSIGQGTSTSQGISTSQGKSFSEGTGTSDGTSNSLSKSFSMGDGTSQGTSRGTSDSFGIGKSSSSSSSVSNGVSHSNGTSNSLGQSLSQGESSSNGTSYGTSQSNSKGTSEGWSEGTSVSQGKSYGTSISDGESQSQGISRSIGTSVSEGQSASKGTSLSVGKSVSDGTSISTSQGYGKSTSDGIGLSQGTTKAEGISSGKSQGTTASDTAALGMTNGLSNTTSQGTSSSMAIGPSLSYTKSAQWFDENKANMVLILDEQRNRLMDAIRQGAFYVDVYILTSDEKSKKAAQILSKTSWYGDVFPCTVQIVEPDPVWAEHLMTHASVFSACTAVEDATELMEGYKYSTILLPEELSAYCHPPRFEGGDLSTVYEAIPFFRLPGKMEGQAFLGYCIATETGQTTTIKYMFNRKNIMHTLICGSSGSGKTTTSLRYISELINKMNFGATILDWKDDWRKLAFVIPEEKFTFYSLGTTPVCRLQFNPLAIPDQVDVDLWVDSVVEAFCIGFGLGQRGYEIIWRALARLYSKHGAWKDTTLSKNLTLIDLYNEIENEIKEKGAKKQSGSGDIEAYNRVLSRMGYFTNEDSRLYSMFGNPKHPVPVEALCVPGKVTVLEAQGMKGPQKSFLLGLISAGVFQVARTKHCFENQPHMIVFEEAHEVVKGQDSGGDNASSGIAEESTYEIMWNEGRSAGLYLVALAQMPTHLPTSVLANTRIYITHQLGNDDDIDFISRRMIRDPKIENKSFPRFLERVPMGNAIIQIRSVLKHWEAEPVLIAVEMIEAPRPTDEQLKMHMIKWHDSKLDL